MDACWHCGTSGTCDCMLCCTEAQGGWKAGPCVACKAKKRNDRLIPILVQKNIDPRDAQHWRCTRDTQGFRRIFIPAEEFSAILKTRDEF